MSIPATNIATQVYPNRYYIDTSELVECVDLPISPFAVDKLTPEGQYRPLSVLMYIDGISPFEPTERFVVANFDKILPGYLIDVTDIIRSFIDPDLVLPLAVGFSVIINVNETLYEVPTKAALVKQFPAEPLDPIINVDFADMVAITEPDPLAFVTETDPFTTTIYHTATGILIPDMASSGGVFRLRRVIDPVFSGSIVVPANIRVIDDSTLHSTDGFTLTLTGGTWTFGINTNPSLDIQILSITAPGNELVNTLPLVVNLDITVITFTGDTSCTVTIEHTGLNTPFIFNVILFP